MHLKNSKYLIHRKTANKVIDIRKRSNGENTNN